MIKIAYPAYPFRIKNREGKESIFDETRKRWTRLTPEEWVRQNFLQYLIQVKRYPSSLIAVEKEITLGELTKRFDILVYNSLHQPWMMVECKAMTVPLNEKVLEQLLRYNLSIPVSFLVITNGSYVAGWQRSQSGIEVLGELPELG
ncbi:MAG: type I restriction enzyme HsdR N-terminal domain-containing protein [Williamsia sp.]|nr:type I restriction enzyme HsdR N-terminal domain-containing protein [Williamsia sp.]